MKLYELIDALERYRHAPDIEVKLVVPKHHPFDIKKVDLNFDDDVNPTLQISAH